MSNSDIENKFIVKWKKKLFPLNEIWNFLYIIKKRKNLHKMYFIACNKISKYVHPLQFEVIAFQVQEIGTFWNQVLCANLRLKLHVDIRIDWTYIIV